MNHSKISIESKLLVNSLVALAEEFRGIYGIEYEQEKLIDFAVGINTDNSVSSQFSCEFMFNSDRFLTQDCYDSIESNILDYFKCHDFVFDSTISFSNIHGSLYAMKIDFKSTYPRLFIAQYFLDMANLDSMNSLIDSKDNFRFSRLVKEGEI